MKDRLTTAIETVTGARQAVDAALMECSKYPKLALLSRPLLAASWALRSADFATRLAKSQLDELEYSQHSSEAAAPKPRGAAP